MEKESIKYWISEIIYNKSSYTRNHDCRYVYPIQENSIRESLVGEGGCSKTKDYFLENDSDFYEEHKNFEGLIENGYFNPYKEYRLSNYYIETSTFKKLDNIFKSKDSNRPIVHVGDKGSGKTATQNCWLHKNNKKLEKNNIFWIRCDAHKLYKLWMIKKNDLIKCYNDSSNLSSSCLDNLVGVNEYINIQLIYVFSKYCLSDDRPFFKKIINDIVSSNTTVNIPISRAIHHSSEEKSLYDEIIKVRNTILKEESSKPPTYSYAYEHVMRISLISQQLEKRKWLAISESLQSFLRLNGYYILRILDGIDNVHINDEVSQIYYNHMMHEVLSFMSIGKEYKYINYIAVRNRTFMDVFEADPAHQPTGSDSYPYIIEHISADFRDIIEKRYNYALKNVFTSDKKYSRIAKIIIHNFTEDMNELHHNNARTFLYNKVSLISLVYYRLEQIGENISDVSRQIYKLEKRNRFLNGGLFLDTKKTWGLTNQELGLCRMNMFYFDLDEFSPSKISDWYGLTKTRVLQLLEGCKFLDIKQIINYLHDVFKYPISIIEKSIVNLRAFGMIDSIYKESIFYEINNKGREYLNDSFCNLDTLYYFSLDTPMPYSYISNNLLVSHCNKFRKRTNYPVASICTSLVFLEFLNAVCECEENKFHEAESIRKHYDFSLQSTKLPFHDNKTELISDASRILDAADPKDVINILSFIKSYRKQSTPEAIV